MSSRCEIDGLLISECEHGLKERKRKARLNAIVQVSPSHIAHLGGCMHKGEDEDFTKWGEITAPGAWIHLCQTMPADGGVVADLVTDAGSVRGLAVTHVCKHCRDS